MNGRGALEKMLTTSRGENRSETQIREPQSEIIKNPHVKARSFTPERAFSMCAAVRRAGGVREPPQSPSAARVWR
jgi:hypothetical protein